MFNLSSLTSTILTTGPFMSLFVLVQEAGRNGFQPPESIAAQTWILTAIGAAMGLVKIIMWVRGNGNGHKNGGEIQKFAIDKLTENDTRISENQQKLAENQVRTLENNVKILEMINILKLMLENQEDSIKSYLDQVASRSVNELKEALRDK